MGWFLLQCKTRAEHVAERGLIEQKYEVYRPEIINKKSKKLENLFPSYLFISLDTNLLTGRFSGISNTRGVQRIVRFGELPVPINDRIIEQIRGHVDLLNRVNADDYFKPGDNVQIMTGPFVGVNAVFASNSGKKRAEILIDYLGKQVPVKVDPEILEKIAI